MAYFNTESNDAYESALGRLEQITQARARYNASMAMRAEERYKEYMAEMKRREEEARRKRGGSWFSNIFKGGATGAIMGGIMGAMGPLGWGAGAAYGGLSGAGMGLLAKGTGQQDFVYGQLMPMASQAAMMYGMNSMQNAPGGYGSPSGYGAPPSYSGGGLLATPPAAPTGGIAPPAYRTGGLLAY